MYASPRLSTSKPECIGNLEVGTASTLDKPWYSRSRSEPSLPAILLTFASEEGFPQQTAISCGAPITDAGSIVLHQGCGSFRFNTTKGFREPQRRQSVSLDDRFEAFDRLEQIQPLGYRKGNDNATLLRLNNCKEKLATSTSFDQAMSDISYWASSPVSAVCPHFSSERLSVATTKTQDFSQEVEIEMSQFKASQRCDYPTESPI